MNPNKISSPSSFTGGGNVSSSSSSCGGSGSSNRNNNSTPNIVERIGILEGGNKAFRQELKVLLVEINIICDWIKAQFGVELINKSSEIYKCIHVYDEQIDELTNCLSLVEQNVKPAPLFIPFSKIKKEEYDEDDDDDEIETPNGSTDTIDVSSKGDDYFNNQSDENNMEFDDSVEEIGDGRAKKSAVRYENICSSDDDDDDDDGNEDEHEEGEIDDEDRELQQQRRRLRRQLQQAQAPQEKLVEIPLPVEVKPLNNEPLPIPPLITTPLVPAVVIETPPQKPKCVELAVLGLPWKITEKQVSEYFETFGVLVRLDVKKDMSTGLCRGFGFIRFANYEAQTKVLAQQDHILVGRRVNVKIAVGHHGWNRGGAGAGAVGREGTTTTKENIEPKQRGADVSSTSTMNGNGNNASNSSSANTNTAAKEFKDKVVDALKPFRFLPRHPMSRPPAFHGGRSRFGGQNPASNRRPEFPECRKRGRYYDDSTESQNVENENLDDSFFKRKRMSIHENGLKK